jgi:hypothetical protein
MRAQEVGMRKLKNGRLLDKERTCRAREGQMLVVVAVALVVLLAAVGLVADGALMAREYSRAYKLADGAARAAVDELDPAAFRRGVVALDPVAAAARADAWLAAACAPAPGAAPPPCPAGATVTPVVDAATGQLDRVRVTVAYGAPTRLLRLVGVGEWRISVAVTHQLVFRPA